VIAGDGQGNFDFAHGGLLFGARVPDVVLGAAAALGDSTLTVQFINTAPGAPLPDLIQLAAFPRPGQELKAIAIRAQADGELRAAFGVADGTPGRAEVIQVGLFLAGFHGAVADGFPAERINLSRAGR
jgi:hypothetical protein